MINDVLVTVWLWSDAAVADCERFMIGCRHVFNEEGALQLSW